MDPKMVPEFDPQNGGPKMAPKMGSKNGTQKIVKMKIKLWFLLDQDKALLHMSKMDYSLRI